MPEIPSAPTTKFSGPRPEGRVSTAFATSLRASGSKFHQKARQKVYYDHPEIWAKEVLGFEAWSKQVEIGQSVVNHSFTAVKSCHGAGKSAWAAVLVCWFVATRLAAGEQVFVITTAPSYAQVHLVLWEEIRAHHAKAGLPGYITMGDQWKIEQGGRTIDLASGRKPADTDANSFQGKHAFNLFIVLDEANGIPELLFTGAVVQLTGDMSRQKMLAIGNPDDPNSQFGLNDAKDKRRIENKEKPFWNTIQIRARDTPNFTEEKSSVSEHVLKSVLQPSWVELRREEWGVEDPRWISKVEAEFPAISVDSLFSVNLIEQAKTQDPDPGWDLTSKILGVDVSRFGGDRTVMMLNESGTVRLLDHWSKKNSIETANRIHMAAIENHVTEIRIDGGNTGGAIIDYLRAHMGYNYRVIEMTSSGRSPDMARWINARAYWYDNLREQMLKNQIKIPTHKDLESELVVIRYKFKKGALQIEEKDEMKKRLNGKSPDFADALVYAAADLTGLVPERGATKGPQAGEQRVMETAMRSLLGWTVSPV